MQKRIRIACAGYCPEAGRRMDVQVVFTEIRIMGNIHPDYKATALRCEYLCEHGCSYDAACPLIKKARFAIP